MSRHRPASDGPDAGERAALIHQAGVERHPQAWLEANMAAVSAANSEGLPPELNKAAIAKITLRVLDVARRAYGR